MGELKITGPSEFKPLLCGNFIFVLKAGKVYILPRYWLK